MIYDVIIAGGGPSGLSAGIILGRCRRKVLIIDSAEPRNKASQGMHGFITRDEIKPLDFLEISKKELKKYSVGYKKDCVVHVKKEHEGYSVYTANGKNYGCKIFVLATGVKDKLPDIKGAAKLYGRYIFHCPYCDGWELSDKTIGLLINGNQAGMVKLLKTWTQKIIVLTNGMKPSRSTKEIAQEQQVILMTEKIREVREKHDQLEVIFENQDRILLAGLFFSTDFYQKSELGIAAGCDYSQKGLIKTNHFQKTKQGFYVIGDAAIDMQMVVVAAAEGAKAAIAINMELSSGKVK